MATTGLDISKEFDLKIDKSYSQYLDPVKKKRLLNQTLLEIIENKNRVNDEQQYYDELNRLTKTSDEFTLDSLGNLSLSNIPNYLHLKTFALQTQEYIGRVTRVEGNVIYFGTGINIKNGELVTFSDVVPNSTLQGEKYCKILGFNKVGIYSDAELTQPVIVTPSQFLSAKAYRIELYYGRVLTSDIKYSVFTEPTFRNPKVEFSDGLLKFLPSYPNGKVVLDYNTLPPVEIDPADNIIDLEQTYTRKFLYFLVNKAAQNFQTLSYNSEGVQLDKLQVEENP
jgi:hypothetical protein